MGKDYSSHRDHEGSWVRRGKKWKARYMGALKELYGMEAGKHVQEHEGIGQLSPQGGDANRGSGTDHIGDLVDKK